MNESNKQTGPLESGRASGSQAAEVRLLSLWQPWASLVAIGAKRIETRSWSTSYRGRLAIHATQAFPPGARHQCACLPFREDLHKAFKDRPEGQHLCDALPRGVVVATCDLVGCVQIMGYPTTFHPSSFRLQRGEIEPFTVPPETNEWHYGDYTPGRYAWLLHNIQPLAVPVPWKGAQGLRAIQWPQNNQAEQRI